jgi:hypothetical protein
MKIKVVEKKIISYEFIIDYPCDMNVQGETIVISMFTSDRKDVRYLMLRLRVLAR